ncbi:MAG TPA: recombinase family protein [Candidatus Paceibacterota bacterium]|nr:recombinase family protein [Candidatus Paceibacterota bacterium]
MKVAYSYRRFSSRQQSDGSSLARQREMAQEVCAANGWQLVDLPPDAGVSAFKVAGDERLAANMHVGNLGAFLKRVQSGDIKRGSVLIIEKLDRFSRNYYDVVFPVWLNLLQSGIEIYSCVAHQHYTLDAIRRNQALAMMALIEMAAANEYSSGMSSRIGKAFSLRLAECAKGRPMNLGGWQPKWVDFHGAKGHAGEFSLNAHANTIRRIAAEYIGGASMATIAKGLIRDQVPSLMGGRWSQGTISHLLKHESLTGHKTIKGVRLERYYPAVISDAEYQKLRAKLADNSNRRGGNPNSDYVANLFRNRCKCAKCGGTITTNHAFYSCKGKRTGECDVHGVVRIRLLELDFFGLFLQEHPAVLLGKQTVKSNGTVAALKARIRDLDKALEDAASLIGKLPVKAVEAKLTALVKEREAAGRELEASNLKMMTSAAAPMALESIKAALAGFVKLGAGYAGSKQEAAMVKAIEQLHKQLDDNETRKKLLNLLPTLVSHLVIDVENKRYRIVNHVGEVSGWRQLAR